MEKVLSKFNYWIQNESNIIKSKKTSDANHYLNSACSADTGGCGGCSSCHSSSCST